MGTVTALSDHQAASTIPSETAPVAAKLQVRDLRLEYAGNNGKTVVALEDVQLNVLENEFAVIVGPSGCGKSSLLLLIAGLAEATSGSMTVGGRPVTGPGADRGMVFQSYTLFPWLTVRQNVEFGPKRRGMPKREREEIVNHYLDQIGLAEFHDSFPTQLSGGMKQRVAIARAMANSPEILLMDEPFGALDSQTRLSMQKLLLKVWEREHKTVLFVTHDIDEAILLGDRVCVMSGRPGRIQEEITIPIPRPRSLDMIMDPTFLGVKRRILQLLRDEMDDDDSTPPAVRNLRPPKSKH